VINFCVLLGLGFLHALYLQRVLFNHLINLFQPDVLLDGIIVVDDGNHVLNIPKHFLSVIQEFILDYQLQMLSQEVTLRIFLNPTESLSHDGDQHVQQNNQGED